MKIVCEGLSAFRIVSTLAIAYFLYYFVYVCVWMVVHVLASMIICVETTGLPCVMTLEMPFCFGRQSLSLGPGLCQARLSGQ